MNKRYRGALVSATALSACAGLLGLLAGCNDATQTARLEAAEKELADLKQQLKTEEAARKEQAFSIFRLGLATPSVAFIRIGSTGYEPIQMELGRMTVAVKDVQPFANGSKVVLVFGNPMAANIDGLAFTVEWGQTDKDGMPLNDSAKSKEATASETFVSGSWNATTVILEGVPPDKLGFVRVKDLKHRSIRLRGGA